MEKVVVRVFLSIPSVDVPSAPSICANDDGEASLRGVVLVFLWKPSVHIPFAPSVYASNDREAVRVFLSIPSVDVPSAPSICVNNDGEASLQGAVRVFLSTPQLYMNDDGKANLRGAVMIYIKDGLRIMVLKGLVMFRVQSGYFGILRRWYNDVGKGHRKWVVDVGKNWDNACGFYPRYGLNALVLTSMIKIKDDSKLRMHNQLRDLGRENVREENMAKPGMHSRLWCSEEASKLWEGRMMAKEFKVLILSKSYNVRGASFISNFRSLESLSLHCCNNLVDIDPSIWNLTNLRVLNLSNCRGLRTLECSSFSALENLKLSDCNKLCGLDGLEKLKSLRYLNMDHCCDLDIWLDLSNFKKLKKLDIVGFKKLTEMQGLDTLELFDVLNTTSCISIERLTGLSNLRMLKELNLASCWNLRELDEVGALESLEYLDMHHCRSIERLPDLSNLTKLEEHVSLLDMDRPGETDTTENNTTYDLRRHGWCVEDFMENSSERVDYPDGKGLPLNPGTVSSLTSCDYSINLSPHS
ncbi:hypothetical protein LguiB_031834 [Lonicera macranthoides]